MTLTGVERTKAKVVQDCQCTRPSVLRTYAFSHFKSALGIWRYLKRKIKQLLKTCSDGEKITEGINCFFMTVVIKIYYCCFLVSGQEEGILQYENIKVINAVNTAATCLPIIILSIL